MEYARASAENFLGEGGNQDNVKIDIGIALLEMQLVEKIGNAPVLSRWPWLVTALCFHLITHVEKN